MNLSRSLRLIFWWVVTLAVLAVLDDLTFGPAFWAISRLAGPTWAFAAVLAVYVPAQVWLVRRGTAEEPGSVAQWFLGRLYLNRKAEPVARNEQRIHRGVAGGLSAVTLSPVIGGVLPPLILSSRGLPVSFVRGISWVSSIVYAITFGALHGVLPALI